MKKIIPLFCILFFVISSYGASANWTVTASNIYDGKGNVDASKISLATVYFFDANILSQDKLFAEFSKGNVDVSVLSGLAGSGTVSEGGIAAANSAFSYGTQGGGSYSYYFAIFSSDQKSIYLSKTVTQEANATTTAKALNYGSQITSPNDSKALPTDGYAGVGRWSQVSGGDVPEPTTCSLLLVGLAGMGLKRLRKRGKKSA